MLLFTDIENTRQLDIRSTAISCLANIASWLKSMLRDRLAGQLATQRQLLSSPFKNTKQTHTHGISFGSQFLTALGFSFSTLNSCFQCQCTGRYKTKNQQASHHKKYHRTNYTHGQLCSWPALAKTSMLHNNMVQLTLACWLHVGVNQLLNILRVCAHSNVFLQPTTQTEDVQGTGRREASKREASLFTCAVQAFVCVFFLMWVQYPFAIFFSLKRTTGCVRWGCCRGFQTGRWAETAICAEPNDPWRPKRDRRSVHVLVISPLLVLYNRVIFRHIRDYVSRGCNNRFIS